MNFQVKAKEKNFTNYLKTTEDSNIDMLCRTKR